jgi:hypothetical protein
MPAGLNEVVRIIRITDQADDAIGGAQPSGTVIYPQVYGRITARKPTQALLEQGLETPTIFTVILAPPDNQVEMDLDNNDQFEVIAPQTSFNYGHRFVVIGIRHSSMTDRRGYYVVIARRFEKAHSNLLM